MNSVQKGSGIFLYIFPLVSTFGSIYGAYKKGGILGLVAVALAFLGGLILLTATSLAFFIIILAICLGIYISKSKN
ncbi:MAG: hypothetical protein ACOWWR_12235 [Eubacteriales bacterium]